MTEIRGHGGDDHDQKVTILLADDHRVVRAGLRLLLENAGDLRVVGEAGDIAEAQRKVASLRPDVLLLDLSMPGDSPLAAIPLLRQTDPGTQIVVLTMQSDPSFARDALRAGAIGYVLKDAADSELVQAVRHAAEGVTYLNPSLGAKLAAQPPGPPPAPDSLSAREVQVLRLIASGHTNAEIAEQLFLSVRTVESHRAHIQRKTGRSSRAALVAYAQQHGLT